MLTHSLVGLLAIVQLLAGQLVHPLLRLVARLMGNAGNNERHFA